MPAKRVHPNGDSTDVANGSAQDEDDGPTEADMQARMSLVRQLTDRVMSNIDRRRTGQGVISRDKFMDLPDNQASNMRNRYVDALQRPFAFHDYYGIMKLAPNESFGVPHLGRAAQSNTV